MTREDAIKIWLPIISMGVDNMPELKEAFDMAFKALEQEPKSEWEQDHAILKAHSDGANEVLDKIRTEIDKQEKWLLQAGYTTYNVDIALDAIKAVVDKYKAESEVEDGKKI